MNQFQRKLAGSRKPLSDSVSHWGLPKEKLFPLDSEAHVKTAAVAFDTQSKNMTPPQRLVCARQICSRADEFGVDVGGSRAFKYASASLSPHFGAWLSLRKEATMNLCNEELDKLAKAAEMLAGKDDVDERVEGLDKVAAALEDFDERHDLQGHWGSWMPDPAYTVFGQHENPDADLTRRVKVASFEVSAEDLDDVDWSLLDGKIEEGVVSGMRESEDKLTVFASLPDPHKEIIYQTLFLG